MSRFALLGVVVAATWMGIGPSSASILGGPFDRGAWCLKYDIGAGVVREECDFQSFEACNHERPFWGTTAFCNVNPAYRGHWAQDDRPKRRHRKHRRRAR